MRASPKMNENLAATNIQKCYKSYTVRKIVKTQRILFEEINREIESQQNIAVLETKRKILLEEISGLILHLE